MHCAFLMSHMGFLLRKLPREILRHPGTFLLQPAWDMHCILHIPGWLQKKCVWISQDNFLKGKPIHDLIFAHIKLGFGALIKQTDEYIEGGRLQHNLSHFWKTPEERGERGGWL